MYGMLNMGGLRTQNSEVRMQHSGSAELPSRYCPVLLFVIFTGVFFLFADFSNPQAPTLERDVLLKLVSDTGARGEGGGRELTTQNCPLTSTDP